MMQEGTLPNVIHAELGHQWPKMLEGTYLTEFFTELKAFDPLGFQKFRFLIVNKNTRHGPVVPPFSGKDVVLIWLSDEKSSIPDEDFSSRFKLVLKSYWPLESGVRNIMPFPLCGASEVLKTKPIEWACRGTQVFFTGNLNANRVDFFRQFNILRNLPPWDLAFYWQRRAYWEMVTRWPFSFRRDFSATFPNSLIRFTQTFGSGMAPHIYAQNLANSKIAICPPGFTSAETIRHFEAMRLGCIIISTPLPPSSFYKGSPIIELKSWGRLHRCIFQLIDEQFSLLQARAEETSAWWISRASPHALAKKVFYRLNT